MPACFTLTPKGEETPDSLGRVDAKICAHFGAPVHPKFFLWEWYTMIGFRLAMGRTWEEIRQSFREGIADNEFVDGYTKLLEVVDFLEATYEPCSWAEMK